MRLGAEQFTATNATYRLDRIDRLGLDANEEHPIVRCLDCGMAYSARALDEEREAILYNEIIDEERSRAKVLSAARKRGDLLRLLKLLSLVEDAGDLRLLDFGCEWGTLLAVAEGAGVEAVVGEWVPAEYGLRGAFELALRPRLPGGPRTAFGYWRFEPAAA